MDVHARLRVPRAADAGFSPHIRSNFRETPMRKTTTPAKGTSAKSAAKAATTAKPAAKGAAKPAAKAAAKPAAGDKPAPAKAAKAAKAKPAKAAKAAKAVEAPAKAAEAVEAVEAPPANRAERRAKGKKTAPVPEYGNMRPAARRNPVAGSRNFAARRSG